METAISFFFSIGGVLICLLYSMRYGDGKYVLPKIGKFTHMQCWLCGLIMFWLGLGVNIYCLNSGQIAKTAGFVELIIMVSIIVFYNCRVEPWLHAMKNDYLLEFL